MQMSCFAHFELFVLVFCEGWILHTSNSTAVYTMRVRRRVRTKVTTADVTIVLVIIYIAENLQ